MALTSNSLQGYNRKSTAWALHSQFVQRVAMGPDGDR
jgi:hypothetical protein